MIKKEDLLRIVFLFMCVIHLSYGQENNKDIFEIARSGSLDDFKGLVKGDMKLLDQKSNTGYTPLILACYNGNEKVAMYIADNTEDINLNNGYGTALMAATFKGNTTLVKYLLKKKANTNITDANGTTALHYAVTFNLENIAELLVKSGAKYNLKDNRGNSAKDYALLKKNERLLTLFKYKS